MQQQRQHQRKNDVTTIEKQQQQQYMEWKITPEEILQGIHVYRIYDQSTLRAVLEGAVPDFLQRRQEELAAAGGVARQQRQQRPVGGATTATAMFEKRPIKLIVVDSLAFPFRAADPSTTDYGERTRQLNRLATHMHDLAARYNLAVVTINQMTTKVTFSSSSSSSSFDETSRLVPALGESWAHAVTTRILLTAYAGDHPANADDADRRDDDPVVIRRTCHLVKSPCRPNGSAHYKIVHQGIRGLDYVSPPPPSSVSSSTARGRTGDVRVVHDHDANKRARMNRF